MNQLIAKIKKARESEIEAGGFKFKIRRPTDMEYFDLRSKGNITQEVFLRSFVIGWNLKEIDLIPGGSAVDVAFNSDLFIEWVSDNPDFWGVLTTAIFGSYESHLERRNSNLGKPENG